MEELGLPAPQTLFGTLAAATATISTLAKAVSTYGTRVTLSEILGATFVGEGAAGVAAGLGEVATVVGALTASFYLGACVGSLIACTINKIFFPDVRSVPIPLASATVHLRKWNIRLSVDMKTLMLSNPEMLGTRPGDSFDARLWDYGYGYQGDRGDTAIA
jgi:hypothetical protein